jgi:NmrA-like family
MMTKTIVVVGATGNQGGSVANTFLTLSHWKVRIITRNPSSEAAQALAARGAEVVQADLSDPNTLPNAFQNAHAIFLNTDYWATFRALVAAMETNKESPSEGQKANPSKVAYEAEVINGKNAASAAAKIPTLERFIYSALPAIEKSTNGKYHSDHADSKGTIVEYIETELPELASKTSFIYMGAYNTNALLSPILDPSDGQYRYLLPLNKDARMPIVNARESTGLFVRALIEDEAPGIKLLAYDSNSYLTYEQIRGIWSRASGHQAGFETVTVEFMHEKLGIPMVLLEPLPALGEFGYTGSIKVIEPGELKNPVQTKSWEEWMMGRDWKTVLEHSV